MTTPIHVTMPEPVRRTDGSGANQATSNGPNNNLSTREDYQAMTRDGEIIRTFSDRDLGVAWVKANQRGWPQCYLDVVTITEARRRAYRPRPFLVSPGPGPASVDPTSPVLDGCGARP
jgi:hypothetical protein